MFYAPFVFSLSTCLCLIYPGHCTLVVFHCCRGPSQRLGRGPNNSSLRRVEVSAYILLPLHSSPWDPDPASPRVYISNSFLLNLLGCSSQVPMHHEHTQVRKPGSPPPSLRSDDANNGLVETHLPRDGLVADVVSPPYASTRWCTTTLANGSRPTTMPSSSTAATRESMPPLRRAHSSDTFLKPRQRINSSLLCLLG